jgi:hypothetical protein
MNGLPIAFPTGTGTDCRGCAGCTGRCFTLGQVTLLPRSVSYVSESFTMNGIARGYSFVRCEGGAGRCG